MSAYSDNLREKVAACQLPGQRQHAVAAQFGVSFSFVAKLLRRQLTSSTVAAKPWSGEPARCLDAAAQAQLVAWVGQQPDSTLAELQALLAAQGGRRVCTSVVWQVLVAHDLRSKRKPSTPPNATRSASTNALRSAFVEAVARHQDPRRCKLVDETGLHVTFARRYGRAAGEPGRAATRRHPRHACWGANHQRPGSG